MTKADDRRGPWYWDRYIDTEGHWRRGRPPGEDLAALRRGLGREPGAVPQLWPFHVAVIPESSLEPRSDHWDPPALYEAEHHALALYGYHQQSQSNPTHRRGVGLGTAIQALHARGRFSKEAVDRRFFAAVTATTRRELVAHLRGLVGQLRSLRSPVQPLDYGQLVRDIERWGDPDRQQQVRRRWALQYQRDSREESDSAGVLEDESVSADI